MSLGRKIYYEPAKAFVNELNRLVTESDTFEQKQEAFKQFQRKHWFCYEEISGKTLTRSARLELGEAERQIAKEIIFKIAKSFPSFINDREDRSELSGILKVIYSSLKQKNETLKSKLELLQAYFQCCIKLKRTRFVTEEIIDQLYEFRGSPIDDDTEKFIEFAIQSAQKEKDKKEVSKVISKLNMPQLSSDVLSLYKEGKFKHKKVEGVSIEEIIKQLKVEEISVLVVYKNKKAIARDLRSPNDKISLSQKHFNILAKLARKKKISTSDLALSLGLKKKSISNLISKINTILRADKELEKTFIIKKANKSRQTYEFNSNVGLAMLVQGKESVPKNS